MTEMRKWIDLVEVKEYFDTSEYGAWINDRGRIEYVEDHGEWVWDEYHSEDYHEAYVDGWIRVVFDPTLQRVVGNSFHINGYLNDIKNIFRYWWPTALVSNKIWIETEDEGHWYEYEMPRDRIKLQKKWKPRWYPGGGQLDETNDGGDCYQVAWRKITSMDFEEAKDWRLVHGEVIGTKPLAGKHFGHAWLEKTEDFNGHKHVMVLDCANNRYTELPRDFYYDVGGIVDEPGKLFRYTAEEARRNGIQTGHYGSWELEIEKESLGLNEEFFDAFKGTDQTTELFINPTKKELNAINSKNLIRGFLTKDSLIVWNAYDSIHFEVSRHLNLNPDTSVGIYLYYSPHDPNIGVDVTDYNRGKWYHNPKLKDWILNHPAWWVDVDYIDISYYDEAIVGKWEDL